MKKILLVSVLVLLGMAACGTPRQEAVLDRPERELDGLQEGIESRGNDDGNNIGNDGTAATVPAPMAVEIGQIIEFGGYDWRVLDIDGNYAKILTENVIFERAYHNTGEDVTWATSDIRAYLNETFFNSFSEADRARIRETYVVNNDNPWTFFVVDSLGLTPGGNNTTDRIFLLSIEEVARHFGGSDLLELGRDENNRDGSIAGLYYWGIWEDNAISRARIAYNAEGTASWWWLRSPGFISYGAANVIFDGYVFLIGFYVSAESGGIRPALWLNLES